jgi:hypothetical protein
MAICDTHEALLETKCLECGEAIVVNGIVQLRCSSCNASVHPRPADTAFSASAIQAFRSMANTITRIFSGDIKGSLNLDHFVSGSDRRAKQRDIGRLNLSAQLRRLFGLDWLGSIELNPYRKPTYGWPSIYVNRYWGTSDPSMELLLACILAEGNASGEFWLNRRRTYPTRWHAGLPLLDGSTVKQLLRGVLPRTIESSTELHKRFIHGVLHAFPDLERRYWIARKGQTAQRHKKSVCEYIRERPYCTKTDVRFALPGANSYLWHNDRDWWDHHVGSRSGYGPPRKNGRRPRLRERRRKLEQQSQAEPNKDSKEVTNADQREHIDVARDDGCAPRPRHIQGHDRDAIGPIAAG